MPKRIALYGGGLNPPGLHHRSIVELAASKFDQLFVIPCGSRPDKPSVADTSPIHRAVMCDLAFRDVINAQVWLDDLERDTFTRTSELDRIFSEDGSEVWHIIGSDWIAGGATGSSRIQKEWGDGARIWNELRWAVAMRPGFPVKPDDLPPRSVILGECTGTSSSEIRECVYRREAFREFVSPEIAAYIERHGLYRGIIPPVKVPFRPGGLRPKIIFDPQNEESVRVAMSLERAAAFDAPNCIAVIGGDGAFMQALRDHWKERLPFIGINTGHRGFFMNNISSEDPMSIFSRQDLVSRQLPMLYVELMTEDGEHQFHFAVNDAWVERATGQTAWIKVSVDGVVKLEDLRADGAIVATPVGSTGYARAMGALPLFDLPGLILAGSNVDQPFSWKPVNLPVESEVLLEAVDPIKRPIEAMIDSREKGRVRWMKVRASRIAAVELVFTPEADLDKKREKFQFPAT